MMTLLLAGAAIMLAIVAFLAGQRVGFRAGLNQKFDSALPVGMPRPFRRRAAKQLAARATTAVRGAPLVLVLLAASLVSSCDAISERLTGTKAKAAPCNWRPGDTLRINADTVHGTITIRECR